MNKTKVKLLFLGTSLLVAVGCGSGDSGYRSSRAFVSADSVAIRQPMAVVDQSSPSATKGFTPRKVIYEGSVSVETDDLDRYADQLENAVRQHHGYVGDANRTGQKGLTREGTWKIRIPSVEFDPFFKQLSGFGELQSSSRTSKDVGEEYYDAASRLKNKRVEEARLVELIRTKTGQLNDIITVEHELSRVREEVEVIQGRLQFLNNQTELSNISVSVKEVKNFVPATRPTFLMRVERTFSDSLGSVTEFATNVVLLIVGVAPWLIPLSIVGLAAAIIMKRAAPKLNQ
jgi:hypothetical protein